jgi:hypothetical protein
LAPLPGGTDVRHHPDLQRGSGTGRRRCREQAEIVGLFQEIDGFRGYHIVKTGPSSAASVTVYDDQAGAEASSQVARDWITANLSGLSISPPQVLVGEVAMSA